MSTLLIAILLIIGLFVFYLAIKPLIQRKFCVICLGIVTTWIILLVFSWLGKFNDPLLLGLLIGQSILGVYYLLESVMEERYLIFRLPLLVTLIYAAYISGRFQMISINAVLLLLGLWAVFIAIYSFLTRPTWQVLGKRVIDCCKSW